MANGCGKADRSKLHAMSIPEHTKIVSRTRGVNLEIAVGPHGASQKEGDFGGLVSANPFASQLQQKFAYANPSKFGGKTGLKEWSDATNQKALPKRAKKRK